MCCNGRYFTNFQDIIKDKISEAGLPKLQAREVRWLVGLKCQEWKKMIVSRVARSMLDEEAVEVSEDETEEEEPEAPKSLEEEYENDQ